MHIPDTVTGFSAGVYKSGNDIVISYTGTNERQVADFIVETPGSSLSLSYSPYRLS